MRCQLARDFRSSFALRGTTTGPRHSVGSAAARRRGLACDEAYVTQPAIRANGRKAVSSTIVTGKSVTFNAGLTSISLTDRVAANTYSSLKPRVGPDVARAAIGIDSSANIAPAKHATANRRCIHLFMAASCALILAGGMPGPTLWALPGSHPQAGPNLTTTAVRAGAAYAGRS